MSFLEPVENVCTVPKYTEFNSDIYFLIQRFLSGGPLQKTLKALNEELEEHKILPKRIDWEGNKHDRSIDDMERQYPSMAPDFLYYLAYQASKYLNPNNLQISSLLSFRPKVKNKNGTFNNYRQVHNLVTRIHGAPIHKLKSSQNIVNIIKAKEISGYFSRSRAITPQIYSGIKIQRISLGHLSAVYCLLFDHSGRYILTGADDLLIKLWSTYTGRLIATFRGASSEITDIAVDPENFFLAAGSIDRIIRVWSLQTGAPLAVLVGHTGMITSVNFCPTPCWGIKYLISTSTDGSVAFWTYGEDAVGNTEFRSKPILYQEKIRPGQAQMICSSFSPGGTFVATGSADHNVRVYYMKGDEGPQRILETEAHTDRVDSIQWAHSGLKFLSGSKDGTAIIWWFERQQWKMSHLDMMTRLPDDKEIPEYDAKKIRVTMVAWDKSDNFVITAVSDCSLKIWSCSGQLIKILKGHTEEIYVLEPHPHDTDVILSAGHDGNLFIWDINRGEIVFRYYNKIEDQGHGGIYDVKWSPDGNIIAASDSHGNILTFGFGDGNSFYKELPKELFFHTDYRPLVRDQNHWVLDEQTQIPPHLMPPPFLVDIDGNPYPPMLQRWVPGREHCNVEQLVPNIVIGNEGTQEVIQDIPRQFIEEVEEEVRGNGGNVHRSQRIRQSTGDWQTDHNIEWKTNILVPPLSRSVLERANELRKLTEEAEMSEYQKQLRQRPHMISTAGPSNTKSKEKRRKRTKLNGRKMDVNLQEYDQVPLSEVLSDITEESSSMSDWAEEVGETRTTRKSRPRRKNGNKKMGFIIEEDDDDDDDDDDTSDDSDSSSDDDDDDDEDDDSSDEEETKEDRKYKSSAKENNKAKEKTRRLSPKPSTSKAGTSKSTPISASRNNCGTSRGPKIKISEQYKMNEWLSETKPKKSPYFPQINDEVVYFVQGHQLYLEAVNVKRVYEANTKDFPWFKMQLKDHEFCKIVDIHYEIRTARLCCLKLALEDEEGRLNGEIFTIKYHDMPDVLDFLVLKQCYLMAMSRDWQPGDKFRCMIDDNWWIGEVVGKSPASSSYPNSVFMCYEICWTNGESERMSPWDMEPIDENSVPDDDQSAVPVSAKELESILYKSTNEDWPNVDQDTVWTTIKEGITEVMGLAIAEPFLVPVDINVYPSYARIIEYPIDLSTIKARIENKFYRRLAAAQFDISYLATNAEKFNVKNSIIVKHANIITELCLRIVKSGDNGIDVASIYHQLVDGYDSSTAEDASDPLPSTSRSLRSLPLRSWKSPDDWKAKVETLLDLMWQSEDSLPFRAPVDPAKYPTYPQIIRHPMDLSTVKQKLINKEYETPQHFYADMKLIFQNSRIFNTNRKSKIYFMTVRLSTLFEQNIKTILLSWKLCKKRQQNAVNASSESDINVSSNGSSNNSKNGKKRIKLKNTRSSIIDDSDSDSDNTPLELLKSRSNPATESDNTLDKLPSEVILTKVNDDRLSQPSMSNQWLETEEHNYSDKIIGVANQNASHELDNEQPSTSGLKHVRIGNNNAHSSYQIITNHTESSDSDSYLNKKKADDEYIPPSHFKLKISEKYDSDASSRKFTDKNSSSTDTSDIDSSDDLENIRSTMKKRGKPHKTSRMKKPMLSDEDYSNFSVNSKGTRNGGTKRKRRKNSSELDEDFEIDEKYSNSRSKKHTRRKRKASFIVDEDDDDNSNTSDSKDEDEAENSSSNSSSNDSNEVLSKKIRLKRRLKTRSDETTDSDNHSNIKSKRKRRKMNKIKSNNDNTKRVKNRKTKGYFASISSRGRVRKITERAAAFLNKDKNIG